MKLKMMLLSGAVMIGLSGCVIPTDRTYYKPEPGFGEAVSSQSCGYQRTKLDALQRSFDDYRVKVKAEKDGRNGVTISVSATIDNPKLDINDVAFDLTKVQVNQPAGRDDLAVQYAFQQQTGESIWLSRTFLLPDAPLEQVIELTLKPGAIIMGDTLSEEMVFRFSLTTTFDVLYFSINC
ncbi:hypothetical protein [Enterovibrio coralii]|uniref:Lipoprotein n=1 Tax=Enterovibrio coralii TaxID=294935 RepID=A0A135I9J7_9GAMM|nr:hypothetical protein [Enterovibrio coralii]KXF82107.1 hypothetical protein ATN88_19830 [Enterovibrio coralii]